MFWLRACGVSFPEARFVSPSLILPFFILYIRWPVTHRISICPSCSCCSSGKEEILYAAAGAQVYCLDLRLVCCESFFACVMATILLCLWLAILSMVWNLCNCTGCGNLGNGNRGNMQHLWNNSMWKSSCSLGFFTSSVVMFCILEVRSVVRVNCIFSYTHTMRFCSWRFHFWKSLVRCLCGGINKKGWAYVPIPQKTLMCLCWKSHTSESLGKLHRSPDSGDSRRHLEG
jgi:hypothetical protein